MTHYIYYSYEEWGRGYIGCRSCSGSPIEDNYFGSFKDTDFKPTRKIILGEFSTREEALAAEILLHDFYDVAVNPHFANLAKQTSVGWDTTGVKRPRSPEEKRKISESKKGRSNGRVSYKHSEETKAKMSTSHLGKTHSKRARLKMSQAKLGKALSEDHKTNLSLALKSKPRVNCPHCDRLILDYQLAYHISRRHEVN